MPLFYFQMDGRSSLPDDDGTELADLNEAISFAEKIAAELIRNNAVEDLIGRHIVIFDEAGSEVKQVAVIPGQGQH
jgi:hypothetical protein